MKQNLLFFLVIVSIFLNGCAWVGSIGKKSNNIVPKTTLIQKPEGSGNNWRYLGTTDDGVLIDEINVTSIIGEPITDKQIFSFQDRKTVITPNKFTYPINQPHFKYLISTWKINCITQEYLLDTAILYNESAVKLTQYNYANDINVKWVKLVDSSFAKLQYEFACQNTNRDLGY